MKKLVLDWRNMDEYTQVPLEYRFVDKVEVEPGKEAVGMKAVSSLDWYFKIHFPGNPIMPGVFFMEAMQQTGLFIITTLPNIEEKLLLFQGCKNMRIYRAVRPGDLIKTYVSLKTYRHGVADFHGEVYAQEDGREVLVCTMDFTQIVQSQLLQVKSSQPVKIADEKARGGVIDWRSMGTYIADPMQYRLVDKVTVNASGSAIGMKAVSSQDWYFRMQDAENPVMPTAFLMESVLQTGVFTVTTKTEIENQLMMFQRCKCLEIYDLVRPGELLQTQVQLKSYRRGVADLIGQAWKDKRCVCVISFALVAPNEIAKYARSF